MSSLMKYETLAKLPHNLQIKMCLIIFLEKEIYANCLSRRCRVQKFHIHEMLISGND